MFGQTDPNDYIGGEMWTTTNTSQTERPQYQAIDQLREEEHSRIDETEGVDWSIPWPVVFVLGFCTGVLLTVLSM